MIKIFINGEALDLENNASIVYKSESSLFENEVDRGEYSYPFKIPLTERNRRILGNIQELSSLNEAIKYEIDWLYMNMVRPAMLYIDKLTFDINTGQGLCEGNVVGVEGLFYSYIVGKKIKEIDLGEPFQLELAPITNWATWIVSGVLPVNPPFVFPTCIFTEQAEKWTSLGVTSEILDVNYLARSNQIVNRYIHFEYHPEEDGYKVSTIGTESYLNPDGDNIQRANQMIPMYYNWWILEKIVTSLGFTLSGDLFDDVDFRKTILTNNYCPNKWEKIGISGSRIDYATEIDPRNHVGEIYVEDYLNTLCKMFCGIFEFDVLKKSVQFNKKITYLERIETIELSNNELSPVIAKEMSEGTGLSLAYNFENDDYIGEYMPSFNKEDLKGAVNVYADLATTTASDGDIYLVRTLNAFYKKLNSTEWNALGFNMNDYNDSPSDTITITIPTAANFDFRDDIWDGAPRYNIPVLTGNVSVFGQRFVAGGSVDHSFIADDKHYPYNPVILYYHGLQKTHDGTDIYPYASASNYSRDETTVTKLANHSLGFHGEEGIIAYRYAKWIEFYKRKTKYAFSIYVDDIKLRALTLYSKVHLLGQNFIMRSTKVKVPYTGIIEAEAYKL